MSQSVSWERESGLPSIARFPTCIPSRRIPFLRTAAAAVQSAEKLLEKALRAGQGTATAAEYEAKVEKLEVILAKARQVLAEKGPLFLVQGASPSHSNAIVGVGIKPDEFAASFGKLGAIVVGWEP